MLLEVIKGEVMKRFDKQPRFFVPVLLSLSVLLSPLAMAETGRASNAVVMADFSNLVQKVTPAIARVNVVKKSEEFDLSGAAESLQRFFGNQILIPRSKQPVISYAYGTAFFVTSDGYMLTNHHVINGADKVTVTLNDRTELDAKVIGSDERSDVAVLKVVAPKGSQKPFPALPIGDSNQLRVGEPVLAIGSPFGFDYSASAGIVSAKSRNFSGNISVPFIQTDVALNPGNSGGPLFNQKGEVVGINARIFSGTGGYMGLSFSIPIDAAMDIYRQIKDNGTVTRAFLGIYPQDLDRNLAEAYNLTRPQGALVLRVSPNSPAQKSGLKSGDVILSYNGQSIKQTADLLNLINRAKPKDAFSLVVQRDGKSFTVNGHLTDNPTDSRSDNNASDVSKGVQLGLYVRRLTKDERQLLNLEMEKEGGVLVTSVDPNGLAAQSGIASGDVIVRLNHQPIFDVQSLAEAVEGLPKKGVVTVELVRKRSPKIIGLRLDSKR